MIKQLKISSLTKYIIVTLLLIATAMILISSTKVKNVEAAPVTGFQAGNIMSDAVFVNKNSMSVSQIQSFLNSKVPYCDPQGTKPSEYGGGTRRQYAASRGVNPPFTCLRDYSQGSKSAAQIIYDAAQEFSINPQVLIVLLQKEQGLITDEWPWPIQYRSATGYGCPDTAACDSTYYGFTNQVRWAGRMFRAIMNNSPTWYTPYTVGNNRIYWHPDLNRCGSSTVNIQNRATAALYSYTPYQPNQAALNAGYGTGNSCSSYGNRNFYQYFKDWFGNTQDNVFIKLDDPRWMKLSVNTRKRSIPSVSKSGPELLAGRHIYFPDKVLVNGTWYLRTQWDKDNGNLEGIPLGDLTEISTTPITPSWKSIPSATIKKDPLRTHTFEQIDAKTSVKIVDSITVDGKVYYRTAYESQLGRSRFIDASAFEEYRLYSMDAPRTFYTKDKTKRLNIRTGIPVATIPGNTFMSFNKRITIDGTMYLQETDKNGTDLGVAIDDLNELYPIPFVSLDKPRWMKLNTNTYKRSIPSGSNSGPELLAGRHIYFPDKVLVNGTWYLRTQWDKDNGNLDGIPLSDLVEIWELT